MCLWKTKESQISQSRKEKKNERLDLVHTDVWGPAQVLTLGGSRYYVVVIDDATRKRFKKWKALVENET